MSAQIICFFAAERNRRSKLLAKSLTPQVVTMSPPENDLFEITLPLSEGAQRVLVRIADQKKSMFRVQLSDLPDDQALSILDRDLTIIGTEFPAHYEPRCIGNLRSYLGERSDKVSLLFSCGGVRFSNLLLARSAAIMDSDSISTEDAIVRAQAIGALCLQWLTDLKAQSESIRQLAISAR